VTRFEPKLSWSSSKDNNLIDDFYRPALKNAILYQRKAGYFSSTSFVGIVNEIIDMIKRNGRIQLVTSPNLSTYDKSILEESVENREKMLSEIFLDDLINDPDGVKQHFAKLMGYMLTNQIDGKPQLEIKIALTIDGKGIFHEKSGIIQLTDGEMIVYQGSVNETFSAWGENTENFVVFCSWRDETNKQGIRDIKNDFEDIWNQKAANVKIFDLPTAVKNHLLKISPKSTIEFQDTFKKVCELIEIKDSEIVQKTKGIELREFQIQAIQSWIDNDYKGIFSMATGTGKTFTAFGCINRLQKKQSRLVIIIACPQTHLVEQWKRQFEIYNNQIPDDQKIKTEQEIMCYGETKWKSTLDELIEDFNRKTFGGEYLLSNFIIFVTHATLNTDDFKNKIRKIKNSKKILIVDEVHNIGAELSLNSLLDEYDYRLGLSATPLRHYDQEGSDALLSYFDDIVFDYPLSRAVREGYLCQYEYHPIYADLTINEMDKYNELTRKIAAKMGARKTPSEIDNGNTNDPSNLRADLIGNAENKLVQLTNILNGLKWNLKQTLIYCTSNPSPVSAPGENTQLEKVNELLSTKHLTVTSITYKNPTRDRMNILDNLAVGHYNCITAVKCLDEGTDIPSVEMAIMLASSGNPKQYIQRRGRVLRPSEKTGKKKSIIYDILVKPPPLEIDDIIHTRERKLVAKELLRHKEFASIAINKEEAILAIKEVADTYGIDLDKLSFENINELE
jgi:superfamily II DNA or RNA helicase